MINYDSFDFPIVASNSDNHRVIVMQVNFDNILLRKVIIAYRAYESPASKLMGKPPMDRIFQAYLIRVELVYLPPPNPIVILLKVWQMDLSFPPLFGSFLFLDLEISEEYHP